MRASHPFRWQYLASISTVSCLRHLVPRILPSESLPSPRDWLTAVTWRDVVMATVTTAAAAAATVNCDDDKCEEDDTETMCVASASQCSARNNADILISTNRI